MLWINCRRIRQPSIRRSRLAIPAALAIAWVTLSCPSYAEDKRIMIFSPLTGFSLPVVERDGHDYVGLVDVLEPLGTVAATRDGTKWRLRFERRNAEFIGGQTQAQVEGKTLALASPFLLESGRGLVPVSGLGALVQEVTGTRPVVFHEDSRRLFVGKVAVRFTEELRKDSPPVLVLA